MADLDLDRGNYRSRIVEFGDDMLEFAAGSNIHLSVDALEMIADSAVAEKELLCDRLVALALCNQPSDFFFPSSQRLPIRFIFGRR